MQQLAPINYPEHLYLDLIEGEVEVEFDIDASGRTQNIEITDKSSHKAFNDAAFESVKNTRYERPGSIPYERNTRILKFKLDKRFIKKRCSELDPEVSARKAICQHQH